ncbi:MAG: hypothetical protein QM759_07965 [Terricaulis sp.]
MRIKVLCFVVAAAVALPACETVSDGYGGTRTQLSGCGRNALIGAAIGGLIGGTQGHRNDHPENAALGAAIGGAGTYGVCKLLSAQEEQRVQSAYYQSLNSGQGVSDSWQMDQGGTRSLSVAQPSAAEGYGGECRRVTATISDPANGTQQLPPETFCRNANGAWTPA